MGALADMLAHAGGDEPSTDGTQIDGGESMKMAAASVKAMFEAAKEGDFEKAADHLASAMEHCENAEGDEGATPASDHPTGDPKGGHAALVLIPHKG
jgi:hypothetical protein